MQIVCKSEMIVLWPEKIKVILYATATIYNYKMLPENYSRESAICMHCN